MLQGGKIMQAIIENYNWLPYGYFEAGVPAGNDTKVLKIGIVSGVSVFFLLVLAIFGYLARRLAVAKFSNQTPKSQAVAPQPALATSIISANRSSMGKATRYPSLIMILNVDFCVN